MMNSMKYETSHWHAGNSGLVLDTTVGGVLREAAAEAPDTMAVVAWAEKMGPRLRGDDKSPHPSPLPEGQGTRVGRLPQGERGKRLGGVVGGPVRFFEVVVGL